MNQLKAGAILTYVQLILGTLISLIYTPIMLKLLGASEYGLFNLASSIIAYLGVFDLGFSSSYVRYYYDFKTKKNLMELSKLNGLYILVFTGIGIITIIAGCILAENVQLLFSNGLNIYEMQRIKILFYIMTFNLGISFPLNLFTAYITAHEKFVFLKIINMFKTIINPLLMLPLLFMGYQSIGMAVVSLVITFLVGIINVYYCFGKLKMTFFFHNINFYLLKDIARFSFFIAINFIIDQINWNIDKFLLGRFKGVVSVAIYSIALNLNSYYLSFSTAISNVFVPRVYKMVSNKIDDKEISDLFIRVGRLQFLVLALMATGLIFFGKDFIELWVGDTYSEAYIITLLLVLPVTIPLIQNLGIDIQRAKNKHHIRSIAYVILAIINLALSIPLCQILGGIGCAIGTAIAMLIGNGIFMNYYYNCFLKINIIDFWHQIIRMFSGLIFPIIVGILKCIFVATNNNVILFIICLVFYVIVYCFSMWHFAMNNYEKETAYSLIKRFRKL